MLDRFDRKILSELQQDGRMPNQKLADAVGLSPSPCLRRVQKLREDKVIARTVAQLDRQALGLSLLAFVHVSLEDHQPETLAKFDSILASADQILECHALSGEYDYLLKVVARDMQHFEQFLSRQLLSGRGVNAANTSFALNERKYTTALPLAD
ncbi:MAG: Lrp/AsnC family transcriptional regulator [Pseudomonadota bacterium]